MTATTLPLALQQQQVKRKVREGGKRVTKMAVVDDTPFFFQPITETVEEAVIGAMAVEEALEGAVVGSL